MVVVGDKVPHPPPVIRSACVSLVAMQQKCIHHIALCTSTAYMCVLLLYFTKQKVPSTRTSSIKFCLGQNFDYSSNSKRKC